MHEFVSPGTADDAPSHSVLTAILDFMAAFYKQETLRLDRGQGEPEEQGEPE